MNSERAQEIRARVEAATPRPWSAADEHGLMPGATPAWCISRMTRNGGYMYDVADIPQSGEPAQEEADAQLIAHAPTDLADLLDERKRLLAVVEAAEQVERARTGPLSSLVAALWLLNDAVRAYRAATTGEAGQ